VETPQEHEDDRESGLQEQLPADGVAVRGRPQVWVAPCSLVVWETLCTLAGEKSVWKGSQPALTRAVPYRLRTVQAAIAELKAERLLEVERHGNTWTYRLARWVEVRAEDLPTLPETGGEVIREAGSFASLDRSRATAIDITSDRNAAAAESGATATAPALATATPLDHENPTYSSSSSSSAAAAAAGAASAQLPDPIPPAPPSVRGGHMGSTPAGVTPAELSPAEKGAWARLVAYHIAPEPDSTLRAITELGPYQERDFWRRIDEHHRPQGSTWVFVARCVVSAVTAWPDEPDGLAAGSVGVFDERGPSAEGERVEEVPAATGIHRASSTTPTPAGLREPTHVEAKAVLVSEMRAAPRPLVELNVPPLPGRDGLVRAGRGLGRALVQGAAEVLRGQRRRRARDPRGGQS